MITLFHFVIHNPMHLDPFKLPLSPHGAPVPSQFCTSKEFHLLPPHHKRTSQHGLQLLLVDLIPIPLQHQSCLHSKAQKFTPEKVKSPPRKQQSEWPFCWVSAESKCSALIPKRGKGKGALVSQKANSKNYHSPALLGCCHMVCWP